MTRYSLERINKKIELWEAADDAVSTGQSYVISNRTLTRVDASFIEQKLDRLYSQKENILKGSAGTMVVRQGRVKR